MPEKVITFKDATVTIHAPLFGDPSVDVSCRGYVELGLSLDQFAALIYPAIDAEAKKDETV